MLSSEILRIAKYRPLTFECVRCGERFLAADKPAEELTAEVERHMTEQHPHEDQSAVAA